MHTAHRRRLWLYLRAELSKGVSMAKQGFTPGGHHIVRRDDGVVMLNSRIITDADISGLSKEDIAIVEQYLAEAKPPKVKRAKGTSRNRSDKAG